jgi:ribonuclease P protein component
MRAGRLLVLPKNARITAPADFSRATKSGIRFTTDSFVGYLYIQPTATDLQPRAGLIVGKSAGGSVQRHRLSRKLRHLIAPKLNQLPAGSLLVIRALSQKDEKSGGESVENQIEKLITNLIRKSAKFSGKVEIE